MTREQRRWCRAVMWCRHLTCSFSLGKELVGCCSHKATRTITLKIASLKIIILKITLSYSSAVHIILPVCHSSGQPLWYQYLFCRCLTLLCNFPFFPPPKPNNDFLLAFILYLILYGVPRSEVKLEAEYQTFHCDCKYGGGGGYLLTNIMSANWD